MEEQRSEGSSAPSGWLADTDFEQFWYHLPEAFLEIDLASMRVSRANRMSEILLGYSAEEFADNLDSTTLATPETVAALAARSSELIGEPATVAVGYERPVRQEFFEGRLITKDGREFEAEAQGAYVLTDDGMPIAIRFVFRDVSERKRTERTLNESSRILELIARDTPTERVLEEVCWMVERILPETRAAITIVEGLHGTGPTVIAPSAGEQIRSDTTQARRITRYGGLPSAGDHEQTHCETCVWNGHADVPCPFGPDPLFSGCLTVPIHGGSDRASGSLVIYHTGQFDEGATRPGQQAAHLAGVAVQRHRHRDRVRRTEERYRSLAEQAEDVVFTVDRDGRLTSINPAGVKLTGYTHGELIGKDTATLVTPESNERMNVALKRIAGGLPSEQPSRVTAVTADGKQIPVEVIIQPVQDDRGLHGFQGIGRDLRSRIAAEETIRENERRLDNLLAHSPVSIWAIDPEGTIVSCLGGGEQDRARLVGRNVFRDGVTYDPPDVEGISRALAGETFTTTVSSLGRSYELNHVPVQARDGKSAGVIITATDVTDRTRVQAEAVLLEQQLRQAQRLESIGRLASGIAHDFNNMLTVILGSANLISSELKEGDPATVDVQAIISASERAANLIQQLLAYGGKQELRPSRIDLRELVAGMEPLIARALRPDIEFKVTGGRNVPAVFADGQQLEQVLMNLAVNARDAMPAAGQFTIEIAKQTVRRHPTVPAGTYSVLRLSDTGIGMSDEVQARIFDPFFTTKPPHEGTGLGLSSALGVVSQSGGYLNVESAPGEGATFTIWLPVAEDEPSGDD